MCKETIFWENIYIKSLTLIIYFIENSMISLFVCFVLHFMKENFLLFLKSSINKSLNENLFDCSEIKREEEIK